MKTETKDLLKKLDDAPWFASVGRPLADALRDTTVVVASWTDAVACCSSDEWQNFTLEQRNLLTMFLHTHARDRYRRWNDLVHAVREVLDPLMRTKVLAVLERFQLPDEPAKAVASAVQWDALGACMELEYVDVRETGFFRGLAAWYLDGRFPCGWGDVREDGRIRLRGSADECDYNPNEPDWL